jgi:hypothetical protein
VKSGNYTLLKFSGKIEVDYLRSTNSMTVILYWGDDDFSIAKAVTAIQQSSLDPAWTSFNYEKIGPEREGAVMSALDDSAIWDGKTGGLVGRYYCDAAMFRNITR